LSAAAISVPIARAIRLIRVHNAVAGVDVDPGDASGTVVATVLMKTELPSQWRAKGRSPSGVQGLEPVTFRFGRNYPVVPPQIRLRADFDRSHPHIQPGSADELPEPCLFAGSPRELLRLRGILGLVEQLADWLDKASTLDLIDPKQGWEPVRRDHVDDVIIANGDWLKNLATSRAGCSAFNARYTSFTDKSGSIYWLTIGEADRIPLGPSLSGNFTFKDLGDLRTGSGVALVAWSGNRPDGAPFLADKYMPETVSTIDNLLDRASVLSCRESLEPMLNLLQDRFAKSRMKVSVPLAVVMLARRPYDVIGSNSVYELCPYVVELNGKDNLSGQSSKVVRPAMHREDITETLLREASGDGARSRPPPWSLIGCGSVGSKIAMHMARAGRSPDRVVDRSNMLPHNYARHAVYPNSSVAKLGIVDAKASLLRSALSDLGGKVKAHDLDIVTHVLKTKSVGQIVSDGCFAIVNTTGSATVREVLGSAPLTGQRPPVVEACVLGTGAAGLMTVEGSGANPSTTDLICEAYLEIHRRSVIAEQVFKTEATEVAVGQGCSALTMPLRDSRLSLFSAAFSERFHRLQEQGLPTDGGLVLLGSIGADGLSQSWSETNVGARIVVKRGSSEIRISPDVHQTIVEEVARKPNSETGGIIYGRYCDVTGNFHVVGTLPAPPDSKFSAEEFVLGTHGLKPLLRDLVDGTGGALYPLGTWHNHLVPSGPSPKDMRTAGLLSGFQYFPLLMLIHTPTGYTHLAIETLSDVIEVPGPTMEIQE